MSTTWTDVITGVSDVVGPAVDEATVGESAWATCCPTPRP